MRIGYFIINMSNDLDTVNGCWYILLQLGLELKGFELDLHAIGSTYAYNTHHDFMEH